MTQAISFQARARAIDHLGRGQIADAPTAVSELWKNAYDAYARTVSLQVFDGDPIVGAVFDDGLGMSRDDVIRRWLVIGTENKIETNDSEPATTLGLEPRLRQGEKGIGRLSAAFLAPATILVSKSDNSPFVVVLVDWRLFENPYLALSDIQLPVAEFESVDAALSNLPSMVKTLLSNLGGSGDARGKYLAESWKRFTDLETSDNAHSTTVSKIESLWNCPAPLTQRHMDEWVVTHGLADHGTAMFLINLNHELAVWATPSEVGEEVDLIKDKLRATLTSFTDPYSTTPVSFNYEFSSHTPSGTKTWLRSTDIFGLDDLRELEHRIEGRFDDQGVFTGQVVAFGQDFGTTTIAPNQTPSQRVGKLGPFEFAIGSFEQDARRTTHPPTQHAWLLKQAETRAGVAVYRDSLRVMPYGRPDADFLGMEERRSKHAGREFWAHRRSFGRVAFSRSENPSLRDKAGREGLVDNRAFREMKILIINLLQTTARKFFGTDAPLREEFLSTLGRRKEQQKAAAEKARLNRRKFIRQFLKAKSVILDEALESAAGLLSLANETLLSKDRVQATLLTARTQQLRETGETLRPPVPPARLGDLEEQWRAYRDGYQAMNDRLRELDQLNAKVDALVQAEDPEMLLKVRFEEQRRWLVGQLDGFENAIEESLSRLRDHWRRTKLEDEAELTKRLSPAFEAKVDESSLMEHLNLVDASRAELSDYYSEKYQGFINSLAQLVEGIDLQGAYAATEDDRAELEERLQNIHAVAQVGITVEIIGHELETLESEVRGNLLKLPESVRESSAFEHAFRAHQALADRLRFLSPLKVAGHRLRETITGEQIANYLAEFFSSMFRTRRIDFQATASFRAMKVTDIPSRVYPVFVNLVNNAVYWTAQSTERLILLDFQQGKAVVADTGPGVDIEDVNRLFTIFFSRRHKGRGVGLYLSRANLAVAGHKIRYATDGDPKALSGANFVIEFKGVRT